MERREWRPKSWGITFSKKKKVGETFALMTRCFILTNMNEHLHKGLWI